VGPRTPVVGFALALLLPTSVAFAADTAPGALKKDSSVTTSAPATGPALPEHANGQANGQQDQTKVGSGVIENAPVTNGTAPKKEAAAEQQSQAGSSSGGAAPSTSHRKRTSTRRNRSTPSATRRVRPRAQPATPGSRSHGTVRSRPAPRAPDPGEQVRATPAVPAPKRVAKPSIEKVTPVAHKQDAEPATGLASINRAADRVIEVIPGVVVLALAGLTALVLMLIVRSWLTERRRAAALRQSYAATVQALATAIEAKDHTTGGHIERVRELGLLLARRLVPREAKDPQMAYGFLLHDTGKLAVPDAILRAPGRLREEEWTLMRRHPEEGVRILGSIPFLDKALDVVRHHHERWDGGGYPDGLAGTEIPLWARIFSVVDALDAMTAERPYRPRCPYDEALEEIRRNAGKQFDPAVVDALAAIDAEEVERLLEPAQVLDRVGAPDLPELEPLEAILAATEAARVQAGDVAPAAPPVTTV
jgi:HD-GYP domain-containing protein (c-di-GMP phosphodiesterase class II)